MVAANSSNNNNRLAVSKYPTDVVVPTSRRAKFEFHGRGPACDSGLGRRADDDFSTNCLGPCFGCRWTAGLEASFSRLPFEQRVANFHHCVAGLSFHGDSRQLDFNEPGSNAKRDAHGWLRIRTTFDTNIGRDTRVASDGTEWSTIVEPVGAGAVAPGTWCGAFAAGHSADYISANRGISLDRRNSD